MGRRTQLLVCIAFLAAIVAPAMSSVSGLARGRAIENRPLASRPSLTPSAMLRSSTYTQLAAYLTDRLPWRDLAVKAHQEISISLFDESGSSQVVTGNEGWLYLARTVRAPCLDDGEVRRIGGDIEQLADVFAGAGKQFRLLVVPEKESLYPQHLEGRDRRTSCIAANSSRLQAEVRAAGVAPGYSSVVSASRDDPDLFYRTDTHWDDRGALVGARDVIHSLQAGLFDPTAYRVLPGADVHAGDLLRLAGTPGTERADAVRADRVGTEVVSSDENGATQGVPIGHELRAGGPLVPGRVLVSHDSSGFALRPLAAPWFADATWLTMGDSFDPGPWGRAVQDADTIVILMVERNLATLPHTLLLAARSQLGR